VVVGTRFRKRVGIEEQVENLVICLFLCRPDMIDPALLRPGRLDTLLYVPLPDPPGRVSIMRTLVRNTPIAADVDVSAIAESNQCEGFSGADLHSLVSISSFRTWKV